MYLADDQYKKEQKILFENSEWKEWDDSIVIHGGSFALNLFKYIGEKIPSCRYIFHIYSQRS